LLLLLFWFRFGLAYETKFSALTHKEVKFAKVPANPSSKQRSASVAPMMQGEPTAWETVDGSAQKPSIGLTLKDAMDQLQGETLVEAGFLKDDAPGVSGLKFAGNVGQTALLKPVGPGSYEHSITV
jgi:hypothetical protein